MSDVRKVVDCSPAELLEAAIAAMSGLGWSEGRWRIELNVEDGRVVRAVPVVWNDPPLRVTIGRSQLGVRVERDAA